MRARLPGLLLACLAAAALPAAEYRMQAATAWVDNLSRTSAAASQRDAAVLALDAAVVEARQLARDWTVVAALEAGREQVPDFRGLDRTARGAPFDTHGLRLAVDASWDLADRWRLAAGAARYDGQIVANATWPVWGAALADGFGPRIGADYRSTPWEITGTFGPGWVAYRVDADADFLWAEASFLLGDRTRATLRVEKVWVVNVVDVRYDTEIWSLALAHRF